MQTDKLYVIGSVCRSHARRLLSVETVEGMLRLF